MSIDGYICMYATYSQIKYMTDLTEKNYNVESFDEMNMSATQVLYII